MTQQEKDKIMGILQDFINDNDGQKITKWNGTCLMGTMSNEIDKMIQAEVKPKTVNKT